MNILHGKPTRRTTAKKSGKGFLEVYTSPVGDVPVLHVAGTPEDMGHQYGVLVGDRMLRNIRRMVGLFTAMGVSEPLVTLLLDNAWKRLEPHTPERYLREMAGIAAGAEAAGHGLTLADVRRITTVTNFDLYKREERVFEFLGDEGAALIEKMQQAGGMSCTMFAVWGSRTVDGKLLASRDLDWVSQTGMHEDRLVTVYRPDGLNAFVTMDYAGVVGGLAGMNEKGLAFSEIGSFSAREELDGTPWTLLVRQAMEEAANLEEGVRIIEGGRHTLGYNYMLADGDPARFGTPLFKPRAAVFETNFECCETFYEDDPKEHEASWTDPSGKAIHYGLPMTEGVARGDMAYGQRTRALQAADNGPGEPANNGDPLKGSTYIECHKPMVDMIRAYESGAEYVYPLRNTKVIETGKPRKIGVEEALTIAATVAHNTEKLGESDWDVMSIVYAPTDLDFWVAYESCDPAGNWKNAPDSGYVQFNLQDLLNAQP
jgi:hypothetical protein